MRTTDIPSNLRGGACAPPIPWFVVLLLAICCSAFDSPGPGQNDVLQPATVTSDSGRYALRVLPADRRGSGAASYTLFLDGEPLWSRELPYAFRRCVVRDDGVAAGFAYVLQDPEGPKELRVAALSPAGEVLWVHPPEDGRTLEGARASEPTFGGVHLHGDGATLMLRSTLWDRDFEEWWAFDLLTGAVDRSVTQRLPGPMPGPRMASEAGRGVPGTPLALVYWIEFGSGRPADGARYILHAADGRLVWELNLQDDLGSGQTFAHLRAQAQAVLLAVGERSFELALLKDDLRVAFEVEEGGESGWTVRETGRRKLGGFLLPKPAVETTPWRAVELEFLGEVVFEADGESPAPDELPGHLVDFDVDASGRIGAVYVPSSGDGVAFALLDGDGRVLRSFELDSVEEVERVRWVQGATWFLHSEDTRPSAAWLDHERAAVILIEDCNGEIVDAELHPDGDLVVASTGGLHRFTPPAAAVGEAERAWSDLRCDRPIAHLAIRPDGALVIAMNGRSPRLELYRPDGVRERVVELQGRLGQYGHVDELLAPDDGTLWLRSFALEKERGQSVWHRLDAELRPLEPITLRLGSGTDLGALLERVGPDGSGWGRDAWGPIRFDLATGLAESIGPLRIQPLDGSSEAVTVDAQGRIYICGEGGAIFVFDSAGVLQRVCRPERGDSRWGLDVAWISVRGDGHVFGGDRMDLRFEFDAHGRRVGVHRVEPGEDFWTFWPGSPRAWVAQWPGTIELRGPGGEREASVDRLHDGRWFSGAWPLSVARDGSVAFSRLDALHVFEASGAPRGSRSLAYDAEEPGYWHPSGILHEGERTILSSDGRFIAIHWDGPVAEVFELPEPTEGPLFRSPDGLELWLFALPEPRMLRFASPANWR